MANTHSDDPVSLSAMVAAYKDPHGLYDRARARDAVCFDPLSNCWLVIGHSAARSILDDSRFSSDLSLGDPNAARAKPTSFVQAAIQRQIIFRDGVEHRRAQKVILRESSHKMQELSTSVRDLAHRLLEPMKSRSEFDLVGDFALPYSLEIVCLVLGVPIDDSDLLDDLARWSSTYANLTSGYLHVRIQHISLLGEYFRGLVAARKCTPSDDLIGAFLKERTFDDEEDLVINCMAAFTAGRVTTQKLLGNGIPMLLPAWKTWRKVAREDPTMCRRLTEELLRMVTPTRCLARHATQHVDLSEEYGTGHRIKRGDKVMLFLEAANRDPSSFMDPHSLEAGRKSEPHVAFGHGAHRCPGASIARLEIQIALEALFATFAELRPHPSEAPSWDPNPNLGGFSSYRCLCA